MAEPITLVTLLVIVSLLLLLQDSDDDNSGGGLKEPVLIPVRVRDQQRKIDFKAAAVLAESVGADLGALHNQINKLCLVVPAGESISADHVEQHVGISKEYNNFELRKALGNGHTAKAYTIAHYFGRHPRQHPLLGTIRSLHNYFMQLLTYHGLPSKNPDALLKHWAFIRFCT